MYAYSKERGIVIRQIGNHLVIGDRVVFEGNSQEDAQTKLVYLARHQARPKLVLVLEGQDEDE